MLQEILSGRILLVAQQLIIVLEPGNYPQAGLLFQEALLHRFQVINRKGTVGPGSVTDIWVLKLDNIGNIVWQNTIGGNGVETAFELEVTADGGAIIGTYTLSMASGDKSENNISGAPTTYDYWVVKVNSSGIVEWENTIGGTGDDYCHGLTQTNDGGFAVSGYSTSPASGDKTENMFGVADYWVVKLDSLGNILWDKNIGGNLSDYSYDIIQLNDGRLASVEHPLLELPVIKLLEAMAMVTSG
ncbi:MAG: hypothetical protein IPI65_17945 [Bacteroidetes bacterium]|nr:hypothetical protein [Bacteroidota bacterium]